MANSDRSSEQSKRRPGAPTVDVTPAVLLLREAFGAHASVEWPQGADGGHPLDVEIRRHRSNDTHRVRLVPYGAAIPDEPGRTHLPVVWVLQRAQARIRDMLRARDESYVDLAGAVHLALPWALVDREGLTPPRHQSALFQSAADPFADKGSLVLRVMLTQRRGHGWGVRELAETAHVGVATASDVVRARAERGLVAVTRRGRAAEVRITDPRKAFEAWTRAYDWRINRGIAVQAPVGDPSRFLRRLPQILPNAIPKQTRWALTLQAGASLVAPHATWDRVHIYVDVPATRGLHSLPAIVARAGWEPAPDGRLVLMIPYYATSIWYGMRTISNLPVVSDLQLALDLWHYPVRGREQAEHLIDRVLWPAAATESPYA